MNKWKTVRLGDVCEVIMGQSPKSEYYNSKGEGLPFLQGNRTFGDKYPIFDTYTTAPIKIAIAQDVIMSVRAPVGDLNITPTKICLGRGVCAIRMKNNNQEFLYYLMTYYMKDILNRESGTVFGSVNKNDIDSLPVNIPEDTKIQQKIGKILKSLDDKIELNNRINKNLEEQAMTLFDEYFPSISIGELNIGKYISPKRGKNLLSKDAISGNVPVVAGGLSPSIYHNTSNTTAPVITISASGANAGYVNLWHIPVWSSDSSFIDSKMTPYVYFWFVMLKKRQKEIFDSQTGSAQPHIYPQNIDVMPISELDIERVKKYNNYITPIFNLIGKNIEQSTRLAALRDTLLPKLMSGEIDVSKVNISIDKLSFVILFHLKFNPPYPLPCKHTPASVIPQLKP